MQRPRPESRTARAACILLRPFSDTTAEAWCPDRPKVAGIEAVRQRGVGRLAGSGCGRTKEVRSHPGRPGAPGCGPGPGDDGSRGGLRTGACRETGACSIPSSRGKRTGVGRTESAIAGARRKPARRSRVLLEGRKTEGHGEPGRPSYRKGTRCTPRLRQTEAWRFGFGLGTFGRIAGRDCTGWGPSDSQWAQAGQEPEKGSIRAQIAAPEVPDEQRQGC